MLGEIMKTKSKLDCSLLQCPLRI